MKQKYFKPGLSSRVIALTVISALIISLVAFIELTQPYDKANASDAYFSTCELPQADIADLDLNDEDKLPEDEITQREEIKRQRELYCELDKIAKTAPVTGQGDNIKLADPDTVRKQMAEAIEKSHTSLDMPSPSIAAVESWNDIDKKTDPVGSSVANLEAAIDVINGYLHSSKYKEPISDPAVIEERDALVKKKADFQRLCDLILLLQSDSPASDPFTQITWDDIKLMDKWGMDTNSIKAIYKMRKMRLPFDSNFDPKDLPISEDGLAMISSVTWMNEGGYAARIQVYDVTTDKKLDGTGCGSRFIALAETQSCNLANLGVSAGDKIKLGVNIYGGKDSKWTNDEFVYSPNHDLAIGYTSNGTTQNEPTPRLLVTGSVVQVKDAISTEHHNIIRTILSTVVGFAVTVVAAVATAVTFGALCPLTGLAAALVTGLVAGTIITAVTIGVTVGFADKSITDIKLSSQNPNYHYFYDKYKNRYTINGFSFVPTGYYNATPVLHYIKPNGESGQFTYPELRLGKGEANVVPCSRWVGQKGKLRCEEYSIPDGSEIWFEAKVTAGDNRTIDESKKGSSDYQHFTFSSRSPERAGYVVQGQTYTGDKKLHLVGFGQADEVWSGLSPYLSAARTEFITEIASALAGIALSVACEGIGFSVAASRAAKGVADVAQKAATDGSTVIAESVEKGGAEASEAAAKQIVAKGVGDVVERVQPEIDAIAGDVNRGAVEEGVIPTLVRSVDDSLFDQIRDAGVPLRNVEAVRAATPEARSIRVVQSAIDTLSSTDQSIQDIPRAIRTLRQLADDMTSMRQAASSFRTRAANAGIKNSSVNTVTFNDTHDVIIGGLEKYINQMVTAANDAEFAARRDIVIRSITTIVTNAGKSQETLNGVLEQLELVLNGLARVRITYQALKDIVLENPGVLQEIFGSLGEDGIYTSSFGNQFFPSAAGSRYKSFFDFMENTTFKEWDTGFLFAGAPELQAKSGMDLLIDGVRGSVRRLLVRSGYTSETILDCIMTGARDVLSSEFSADLSFVKAEGIMQDIEKINSTYASTRNAIQTLLDHNDAFRVQMISENKLIEQMDPIDIFMRDNSSGGRDVIAGKMPSNAQLRAYNIMDEDGNIIDQETFDMLGEIIKHSSEYRSIATRFTLMQASLSDDGEFTQEAIANLTNKNIESNVPDFGLTGDWTKMSTFMMSQWYTRAKQAMSGVINTIVKRVITKYTANLLLQTERFLTRTARTIAMTAVGVTEIASDLFAVDVNEFALKAFIDNSYIRTAEGPVSCSAIITPECLNSETSPQTFREIYSTLPTAPVVESLYATALNYITVPQIKNNNPQKLVETLSDPWDEYYCVYGILKGGSNIVGNGFKPYCDTGRASAQPEIRHHEAETTGESHYEDIVEEAPTVDQVKLMRNASDEALLALHDITSGEIPEFPESQKGLDKNPVDVSSFYGDSMLGDVVQEKWDTDNSGKVQSLTMTGWTFDPNDVRDPFSIHISYAGKEIVLNPDDLKILPNSSSLFPMKYANLMTFDNMFSVSVDVSKLDIKDRDGNLENVKFTAYNLKHPERSVLLKRDSNDINLLQDGNFEFGYFGYWQYEGNVVVTDAEKANKTADEVAMLEQQKIADTFDIASDDEFYGGHFGQINIDKNRNANKVQKIYQRTAAEVDGVYTLNSTAEVKDADAEVSVLVNGKLVASTAVVSDIWTSIDALSFEAKRGDLIEVDFSANGDGTTDGYADIDNVTLGYSPTEPSLSDIHFTMVGPKELKIGETGTFVVIPNSDTDAMFVETVTDVKYDSQSQNSGLEQSSSTKICSSAGLGTPLNSKLTCGTNQVTSSFINGSEITQLKPFQITVTPSKSGQMDIQMATRGGQGKSTLFTVNVSDEKYNALEEMNRWGNDDPRKEGYDMPDLYYLYPLQNPAKMQKDDIMDFVAVPNAYYLDKSDHINIDFVFPSNDKDVTDENELSNIYQLGDESVFDSRTTAHLKFGDGNHKLLEPFIFAGTVNQMGDWYVMGGAYPDFNSEVIPKDGREGSWVDSITDRRFNYHVGK